MTDDILRLEAVTMSWDNGDGGGRTVLDGADLRLARGEAVSLVGRSGSGKSTLLHVAAGIAVPTSGRVTLAGHDLTASGEETRARRRPIGQRFSRNFDIGFAEAPLDGP